MYFEIIEVLRGLSCLSIIYYHFSTKQLPNGYLGVDQFFVISGYLISFSIHHTTKSSFSIFQFINKRMIRIFPLKCVTLFYVLILNKHIVKEDFIKLEKNGISVFLFFFNYKLIKDNDDYFSSNSINLILNFWTLSVEEQYYFYISIISKILIVLPHYYTILLHLVVFFASFTLFRFYINDYYIYSFYSIETRLWEFSCGSLIHLCKIVIINKFNINIILISQILLFASSISGILPHILVVILTLTAINYSKYDKNCMFFNCFIKYIGRISYTIYLIHYSNILLFNNSQAIASIVICSISFYYAIEKPFRCYTSGCYIIVLYAVAFIIYYWTYSIDCRKYNSIHTKKVSIHDLDLYFIKDHCSYDILNHQCKSKYNILLLGDSHVLHYLRAFYDNSKTAILYHAYCNDKSLYYRSYNHLNYLFKYMFNIIIIGFWNRIKRKAAIYEYKISQLINDVSNLSKLFLVISDNPTMTVHPNYCLLTSRYCYGIINVNCSVVKPYNMSKYRYNRNIEVYEYNANKYIIKGRKCLFEINDIPVYKDFHHFSSFFVENILLKDIHLKLNLILKKNLWKAKRITSVKYHCLEKDYNAYSKVCINHNYKILSFNM